MAGSPAVGDALDVTTRIPPPIITGIPPTPRRGPRPQPRRAWIRTTPASADAGSMTDSRCYAGPSLTAGLYAAWVWGVVAVLAPAAWICLLTLRSEHWRWRALGAIARTLLALIGVRVDVCAPHNLPSETPFVAVANHASYLDGLILLSMMQRPVSFVVKGEFARYRYTLGLMMRRLGVIFVSRDTADTRRLIDAGKKGRPIVLFSEGRLETSPRLEPFHKGAFVVAAHCGFPVVPLALRGTRDVLPPGSWRPRRARITVRIAQPIASQGPGSSAIDNLRDAVRSAIADSLDGSRPE